MTIPVPPSTFSYQSPPGSYDEIRDMNGLVRSHWIQLIQRFDGLGVRDLSERWNRGRRMLRNHGVTYNAADTEGGGERPWELDMTPFLLDRNEWDHIERGVIQRAHLHNLILQDIYTGPQRLLKNGLVPPAIVFSSPNYLRCCRGIRNPDNLYLHLHAIDLARSMDGRWWVFDDRFQTPRGVGYALENRTVIGRIFQDLFQELKIEPIHPFFSTIRKTLVDLAPSGSHWPRVVVLTPGIHSAAYYEHALMARFLGYTLVEGGDLVVRDGFVQLKTVEGLQRVDAILRWVNDHYCDPLELREDSFLGVPGLVHAARLGNVLLANALGSAVVETPALHPSLPALASSLLGEELILPTAPSWWCGEDQGRDYVLNNLERLIIKSAFPSWTRKTKSGAEMSKQECDELRQLIAAKPHHFVGQGAVELSSAPVWASGRYESRPIVLRVYVAAQGDSFVIMPGGMTKVSPSNQSVVKGLQLAGGSKDTWIISRAEAESVHPPITLESRPRERIQTGVPSRTADNFYWLGRYTERLEHLLQLLRSTVSRLLDEQEPQMADQIHALGNLLTRFAFQNTDPLWSRPMVQADQVALNMAYSPEEPGGLADLCRRILHIVNSVRDRFSGDAWRVLNRLKEFPGKPSIHLPLGDLQNLIHELLIHLAALTGLQMESMTRGHEWRFLDLGKRLERCRNLCHLLHKLLTYHNSSEVLLNPLLEVFHSSMTYRNRYYSEPEIGTVLDALLLDENNPQALKYNLNAIETHLEPPPTPGVSPDSGNLLSIVQMMIAQIDESAIKNLTDQVQEGRSLEASILFSNLCDRINLLSDHITAQYFSLLPPRSQPNEFPYLSNSA